MKKRFLAILTAAMLLMTCAALGEAAPAGVSGDFTGTAQGFGGDVTDFLPDGICKDIVERLTQGRAKE